MRVWILDEGLPDAADIVRRELVSQGARVQHEPDGAGILVWLRPGPPPPEGVPRRPPHTAAWVITRHRDLADWQAFDVDIVHVWPDDHDRVQRGARAMLRRLGVSERLGYAWDLFDLAPTFNGVIELTPTGPVLQVANRALSALIERHPPAVVQQEVDAYQELFDEAAAAGAPVERLRDRVSGLVGPIRELVRCVPTAVSRDGNAQVALLINNLTAQMLAEQRLAASEARLVDVADLAAQERLAAADRLRSLGTLAAGVGHEINNPLGFVLANLEFARGSASGEAAVALDEALEGVTRIRAIVDDLRNFAKMSAPEVGAVALGEVVARALRLMHNEIRHRAVLVARLDAVPRVVGQPMRLGQVVTNLVANALAAIPDDRLGTITVSLRPGEGDVVLEVQDDGVGIAPEVLPQIFDPFFSARAGSDGRGLGLSVLHGIVSAVGGRIDVESQLGVGSRFTVHLPLFVEVGPAVSEVATAPSLGRRLLVVDDEPMIGRAIARMLGATWQVGVYRSTAEAMAALSSGARFDVCLCDLMMPGDGGAVFAEAIARRQPALARKTGFVTGGAFTDEARAFAGTVSDRVLTKPFDRATLEAFLAMLVAR